MTEAGPRDRGLRLLLTAAGIVVVIAGLRAAGQLILPLLVATFLATISLPLMAWLQRKGLHRIGAVLCAILANAAVLAVLIILVGTSINEFTEATPRYQARLHVLATRTLEWLEARRVEIPRSVYLDLVNPAAILDLVRTSLTAAAAVLSNVFVVLLTLVFILFEAAGLPGKLQAAFGPDPRHAQRLAAVTREVQHYLALKTLLSLATGVLVGVWVAILGVDFALLWGFVAFALNYIPNLGSILAAVPPILLAMVQFGPGHAVVVALGYLAVNVIIGNFVEPYLMGRRLGLSTLVVFLSLIFWGWVWGPVGMLLSVPLTMIVKIMLERSEEFRWLAVLLDARPPDAPAAELAGSEPAAEHPRPAG